MLTESDNLQPHTASVRRLIGEHREITGTNAMISIGAITHKGVSAIVTISSLATTVGGDTRGTVTFEIASGATNLATGWQEVQATGSAAGPLAMLQAKETNGLLELRINCTISPSAVSAPKFAFDIQIDMVGVDLAWSPTATQAAGVTAGTLPIWAFGGRHAYPFGIGTIPAAPPFAGQTIKLGDGSIAVSIGSPVNGSYWQVISGPVMNAPWAGAAKSFAAVGGSHVTQTAFINTLPYAGDWLVWGRGELTVSTAGAVVRLVIGVSGQTVECAFSNVVGTVPVAFGPVTLTNLAKGAQIINGVTAPGFTASGSYKFTELLVRPVYVK